MIRRMNDNNKYNSKRQIAKSSKRNFKEDYRQSIGAYWKINSYDSTSAYRFACDYFGTDEINSLIVEALTPEELVTCLSFIFKINDVTEYYEDEDDEY